jgi:hypothetical protein
VVNGNSINYLRRSGRTVDKLLFQMNPGTDKNDMEIIVFPNRGESTLDRHYRPQVATHGVKGYSHSTA